LSPRTHSSARGLTFTAPTEDNARLSNLVGPLEQNLRQLEEAFEVRIARRFGVFTIAGPAASARRALQALQLLYHRANQPLSLPDVQLAVVELTRPAGPMTPGGTQPLEPVLQTRRSHLSARTPRQQEYLQNIVSHDITFGIGPAGTGKTYLAVACAVDALERDAVKRIILTRPAVEAGERLGFLPGDLAQKVDPYLRPLYDALYDLMGFDRVTRMFEKQAIEIAPLAYMRGRTLNEAFIILDEAQNTTPEQMKMFLTRIGFGSRAVITGDTTQLDLPRGQLSGLVQARAILGAIRGIAFTQFDSSDVVRHPLVARIVDAYEQHAGTQ
jgi:phosphate starvation-inducible protein PhoH and related proteins